MTRDEYKNVLVEIVSSKTGVKGTELVALAVEATGGAGYDMPNCLKELVVEGRMVELEYVLPDMPYRCKSLYFPVGTKFRAVNYVKKGNNGGLAFWHAQEADLCRILEECGDDVILAPQFQNRLADVRNIIKNWEE